MALAIRGEILLRADRPVVWAKLNDPAVLRACLPNCHSLERITDTTFLVAARVRIGPVIVLFKGDIKLSNVDPLNGYRMAGGGKGGLAGFATGGADVVLQDAAEGGTRLLYAVQASVGGRLAKLGSFFVDGVARNLAESFFSRFAAAVAA